MSTNEPSDAELKVAPEPTGEATADPAEELESAALLEEVSGTDLPVLAPPPPVAAAEDAPAAAAVPASDDEAVEEVEPEPDDSPPRPALPGLPRGAPPPAPPSRARPPQRPPGAPIAPQAETTSRPHAPVVAPLPTVDETIAAARAVADARAAAGGEAALIAMYESELAALGSQSRGRQALYTHEIGELAARAGDEGGAVKAWARSLQADPSLRPNLWSIRRAFERREMWPNVLRLLEAELRFVTNPSERAELMIERGIVLEDRAADTAGATAAFEAALKEDPTAIRAYMALERRIFDEGGDLERLRRVLGGLAAASRDPARRVALLVDLARLEAADGADGVTRARAVLDEALALELGDGDAPTAFAGSGSPAALDELERLAWRADRPQWREEALDVRVRLLAPDAVLRPPATTADAERLVRGVLLRLRQAALAEERGDAEAAFGYLEAASVLADDDVNAAAVVACELLSAAHAGGRAELAGRLAQAEAETAPVALRGALYLEAIDAFDRAGRLDLARATAAHAEAAGLVEALDARARRRAERAGDDEALLRTYLAEAERATAAGESPSAALARAAVIAGERLGRHEEALAISERALAVGLDDEHAEMLEWRLLRIGRFADCAALLQRRIEAEAPGPRRAVLRARRVALLAERIGDPEAALAAQREIVEARPDDARARLQLAVITRMAVAPAQTAAQLLELGERSSDVERKVDLQIERGSVLGWQLADAAAAEAAFREVLQLQPGEGRATAALEDLFERQRAAPATETGGPSEGSDDAPRRVDALVAALRAEIDANANPERAPALLSRLAELHERERKDPQAAAGVYQELLDRAAEPEAQAVALRGLQRAHVALDQRAPLLAALEREDELLTDGAPRLVQRARIAWEKERHGETAAAEEDHRRIAEAETAPVDALAGARLGALRAAYRVGDAPEIAASLGAIVALVDEQLTGGRAALDIEHAAALTAQGELDEAAVVASRARLQLPESNVAKLAALTTAGRRDDARGVAAALGSLGESAKAPNVKAALLRRAGVMTLASGGDGGALLVAAAAAEPHDASVLALAELGEVADPVATLGARAALAENARRQPWLLALGEAQAEAGQLAAASASFSELLVHEPHSILGLELDRRVRLAAGDRRGHARRTLALGELVVESERASTLLVEAGEALAALGEREAAVYAYREALARTPLDGAIYARARALLIVEAAATGDDAMRAKAALLELYDHRLVHVEEPPERVTALLERAELCAGEADRVAAERDLRAALEIAPDEPLAIAALFRLCAEDPHRLDETRTLAGRLASLAIEPATRRDLLLLASDVEQREGGDPDRAIEALEAAVLIDQDAPSLRALAALLLEQRRWQRAIDVRRSLIPLVRADEGALIELAIADIYLQGFADAPAAREAALRALRLDPLSGDAAALLVRHGGALALGDNATEVLASCGEAARALLGDEARRGPGLAHLRAIALLQGDEELDALAIQLGALDAGHDPEPRAVHALPERALDAQSRAVLRSTLLDSVACELLVAVGETATRLHPIDAARFGKLSRVSSKQRATELRAFDLLARIVGAADVELELGASGFIESDHERVIVGRDAITVLGRAQGRFRATRALTLFADRLGVLDRLDDAALLAFFAGCLAVAKVTWPAALAGVRPPSAIVDERARVIDKALARRERKALLALAPRLAELPDPRRFRAAALVSAARTAIFVSGDLSAPAAELGASVASELGRFAVSAGFVAARRRWLSGGMV